MNVLRLFIRDYRGSAGVEFALTVGLLTIPLLSAVDVGVYTYDKIQLENAAQVAGQSVWATCTSSSMLPATNSTKCPGLQAAITSAAQTSSLSTGVTVTSVSEGYYCIAASGATGLLTRVPNTTTGDFTTPLSTPAPTSCGTGTWLNGKPGDYIAVTVHYTYSPIFGSISMANLLDPSMNKQSWMRLG